MRRRFVFAFVFLACAIGLEAQRRGGGVATLAIFVTDPDGKPVSNVRVTVEGQPGRTTRTERGRVAMEGLPAGTYRLRFEHDAFEPLEQQVTARGGKPVEVKVTLTPAPKPAPPPPPPPPPPPVRVEPFAINILAFLDKNFVGRSPGKTSALTCAADGTADLLQMREPLDLHTHAGSDEFVYVVAGEGTGRVEGVEHRLHAGVLVMVPRGAAHGLTPRGRNPLIVLSIKAGQGCGA